jgi:23S rRNA pseudouridine955/2504/2580 synthase
MPPRRFRQFKNTTPPPISDADAAYVKSLVIHDDAHVLGFDKPSGLAVQAGSGAERNLDQLLWAFVRRNGKRPHLVHRLDRETSGVLVAAKTQPAAAALSAAFAGRETAKTYLALVCGPMPDETGEIDLPLVRAKAQGWDVVRPGAPDEADAMAALTRYQVIGAAHGASLVTLEPVTGRMHQLRAHCAALGAPIAGDLKYGGLHVLGPATIPRLMLHAARLEAPHPGGGRMTLNAPLPADMQQVLSTLGLNSA